MQVIGNIRKVTLGAKGEPLRRIAGVQVDFLPTEKHLSELTELVEGPVEMTLASPQYSFGKTSGNGAKSEKAASKVISALGEMTQLEGLTPEEERKLEAGLERVGIDRVVYSEALIKADLKLGAASLLSCLGTLRKLKDDGAYIAAQSAALSRG